MRKIFMLIILCSSCSYLPSKNNERKIEEWQTTMDPEKSIYKFCKVGGANENRCPEMSIKTSVQQSLMEKEVKMKDLIGNVVDVSIDESKKINRGPALKLNFVFGSTELYQDSLEKLKMSLSILKGKRILLKGYTDNIGRLTGNKILAVGRVRKIETFLRASGLKEEEIKTEGYPLCCYLNDNSTKDNRRENRRVEIYLSQ
ncbi:MAG: OmpA family protein [Oligoflexia bacterium]|nr:OmpA family protein [Oligoflexia bacterium]